MVTNARSPGSKCYGFVTMSTPDEATKCIQHLHRTELHGKMISVERVCNPNDMKKMVKYCHWFAFDTIHTANKDIKNVLLPGLFPN